MTLRLRLVLALVVLVAAGLVLFGAATYTVFARSQYQRLDVSIQSYAPFIDQQLDDHLILTSISSYFHSYSDVTVDIDKGPLPFLTGYQTFKYDVGSEELRLANRGELRGVPLFDGFTLRHGRWPPRQIRRGQI